MQRSKAIPIKNLTAVLPKSLTSPNSQPLDPIGSLWPRSLCVERAAAYTNFTCWRIEELFRSGEIVAFKEGKKWMVDRLELDRYIRRRTEEAAALLADFVKNAASKKDAA